MKSQSDLHVAVLKHQGRLLGVDTSHDIATLMSSIERQGELVLTEWLPALGKAFEASMGAERLSLFGIPLSTARSKADTRPRFLHGFWALVFDDEGVLLLHPKTDAIKALRQILLLQGKLKELPSDIRVQQALDGYVNTDNQISQVIPPELIREFRQTARRFWGPSFSKMERELFRTGFLPDAKHGPGAVSQPLTSNGKWRNKEWTERLERFFRSTEFLNHDLANEGDDLILHPPGQEPPARVIAVPKTALTPRIISIEPVYNQFVQQGLAAMFTSWMYKTDDVSFEFREPNMELARAGSRTGSHATIDLSEASDRISLRLVKELFGDHKYLLGAILACRSMTSELPDGTRVLLKKFASMGSALTFPIQTLVFATIARMAMKRMHSSGVRDFNPPLRVYGDDIVIPTYAAPELIDLLTSFGLKVNYSKSFWTGRFRESCGGEYFAGADVGIVRTRKRLPSARSDVEEVVAIVAFRNLYWKMYGPSEVVTVLDELIERLIPFPEAYEGTAGLVAWSYCPIPQGWDKQLQRPYVWAMVSRPKRRKDPLDGNAALLKYFWTGFQVDSEHLQYAGRPVSSHLKHRKVYL
jgi:hypothetical protein